ncbi:transmembrane protein [Rhynchospora pubera]|uniref:Transmembrane protein n=1 Tax=Rhynchospora pubera TaxID=906938 RepID=A0AAV8ECZ4_9POAL|nr:transmembrane protein [Rhynchospora pubera]
MAEAVDLDEWELLSPNSISSCKDEFEEDDFAYFDYFSKDLEPRGEVLGTQVGDCSGKDLLNSSPDFDFDSDQLGLGVVTDPDVKDANFVEENPIMEFDSGVNCVDQDSVEELGFGEMEVLNEFYCNQIDSAIVNCLKGEQHLERGSEQSYSENLNDSVFPFQGIDNSDSVFACEPNNSEVLDWRSPKAIFTDVRKEKGGFFGMEMSFQIENSDGDCSEKSIGINSGTNCSTDSSSNLAKDPEKHNISFDENKPKSTESQAGTRDGGKGEKVVLAWWKIPIEVIRYCIFGVRPVWSISMAMGFLGFVMFSRNYYLHRMKQKDGKTRPPVKVHFDEKKRAAIQTRAARLNKKVSLVRPDPILRTPLTAFGVSPFPAMSSFQWAP